MLYQLHWQNLQNLKETVFVAQANSDDFPKEGPNIINHFIEIINRRKSECPDGFVWMICNRDSEYFCFASKPVNV